MKIKVSTLVNLMLSVALVVSFAANLTGALNYDPWLDVNDDGYGGIDDIVSTAEHFGASGDPTKQCNITNWPVSRDVPVWYNYHMTPSSFSYSLFYDASGFGHLHVLAYTALLTVTETITIRIYGQLYNALRTDYMPIIIYEFTLTESFYYRVVTIPVPCESFFFYAEANSVADTNLWLSFYLTWS